MQSKAVTVEQYLAELPEDRRAAVSAVREVILANLPDGYEEGMQYGMIGYYVPHSIYPAGYHCDPRQPLPFASLAAQKNHLAIYLMCVYGDEKLAAWFRQAWARTGKKLDMGKSCVRFKRVEDVPLEVIGQAIAKVPVPKYVAFYESTLRSAGRHGRAAKKATVQKTSTKKAAVKKATVKKATASKAAVKKAAATEAAVKKTATRRVATKKTPVEKAATEKPSVKKMTGGKRRG